MLITLFFTDKVINKIIIFLKIKLILNNIKKNAKKSVP